MPPVVIVYAQMIQHPEKAHPNDLESSEALVDDDERAQMKGCPLLHKKCPGASKKLYLKLVEIDPTTGSHRVLHTFEAKGQNTKPF